MSSSHEDPANSGQPRSDFPTQHPEPLARTAPLPSPAPPAVAATETSSLSDVEQGGSEGESVAPRQASSSPDHAAALVSVPGYEIEKELGRGGMGVVYRARHLQLNRTVALKMILAGGHAGQAEMERFRTEAEAIARLQHPGIVQVFEVGEHQGMPFFSLEYCSQGSLDDHLDGTPLPPRESAQLVQALAEAMHAAHQAQVIHRDLKPANVLLAPRAGIHSEDRERPPVTSFVAKITDFGLAKKLDEATRTQTGAVMGTPSYMAPEQAGGKKQEVGPLADVYALGAVLYECLTGRPPFKAATGLDTLMQVLAEDPVPPTRLQPATPRDLETICLKCLHKEPHRRYDSAAALADDLRRFLEGEPVKARPIGRIGRTAKWARRNPVVAALTSLLLFILAVAFGLVTWQWLGAEAARREAANRADAEKKARQEAQQAQRTAEEQRRRAEDALRRVEVALYFNQVRRAGQEAQAGNKAVAERLLDECRLDLRRWEWHLLRNGQGLDGVALQGYTGVVYGLAFSPDGRLIATACADGGVRLHEAATGKLVRTLEKSEGPVRAVAFSPDGKTLVSGGADSLIRVWETDTGKPMQKLTGHTADVVALAFSPDGRWFASGSEDYTAMVWDLEGKEPPRALGGRWKPVVDVAFRPDGKRLATAALDGTVKLWDLSGGPQQTLCRHSTGIVSVAFSARGGQIITAGLDGTVQVWDEASGKEVLSLRGNRGTASYNRQGTRIAAVAGGHIKLWDVGSQQEILALRGPDGYQPTRTVFSPDGLRLAAAWEKPGKSGQGEVRIYNGTPRPERFTVHPRGSFGTAVVALSPDGKQLLTAGLGASLRSGSWQLWDTTTGLELMSAEGHVGAITTASFRSDGLRLATGASDCTLMIWDTETGKNVQTLIGHRKPILNVVYSPDGTRLASLAADGVVHLWDPEKGKSLRALPGHSTKSAALAYAPDGSRIAALGARGNLLVWDVHSGAQQASLPGAKGVIAVAFSPAGRRLATAGPGSAVRVWDLSSGKILLTRQATRSALSQVSFAGPGPELSVLSKDGRTIQVWDGVGREIRREQYEVQSVGLFSYPSLAMSDRFLAAVAPGGKVQVWERKRGD
jgi:WD40 repeat protein